MRNLVFSLYLGVFVALLGLGWAIDHYYQGLDDDAQQPYQGYTAALSMATDALAELLPDSKAMEDFILNQPLVFTLEPLNNIPLPDPLARQRDRGEVFILQSDRSDTLYRRIAQSDWLLSLEIPLQDDDRQLTTRYLLTFIFYAGVAAILFLWLSPLMRGIRELNQAAKKIGEGDLSTRVANPDGMYLKPLKTEFNSMAQRLQQLNENNQLMSQAVSHELRTPLSRLRFALDMIQGREDEQQRTQDIRRMEADLDDMEDLINELLNYSRLDKQPALELEPIRIESLIRQRIARFVESGCQIELYATNQERLLSGDHAYLCKLVDNLVQNACRYARHKVSVSCSWNDSVFCFRVDDDGVGIAEDQREQIFKPFFRVKNQSVKKSTGFGLGLAIVKRIVQWHAGSIQVLTSQRLGGASFEVRLPVTINNE
jgi:two-component system, OmpR family, sensor kinase